MYPRWAIFCAALPLLVVCSGPDNCTLYKGSYHGVSLELESLMCYNDYKSHIYCQWREDPGTPARTLLELWNWNSDDKRESLCEPTTEPFVAQDEDDTQPHPPLTQCRFNVSRFAIGIDHTFFFKTAKVTSCSSFGHSRLDLSKQLRVRPPVDLSTHTSVDGGQLIQWSSPYPAASPLSQNLTFQLGYRAEGLETWKNETLTETHLKLSLLSGCWYEARVRAMGPSPASLWSEWSPLVAWKTPEAAGQAPSMQCVLDGEERVSCSWELSRELAHFITYQLACQDTHSSIAKWCCPDPEVTPVFRNGEALLRYSCSLAAAQPEHMMVELVRRRNVKSFQSHRNIRPNPPTNVRVAEKGGNWVVKWDKPDSEPTLSYQVLYWCPLNEDKHLWNVSEGSRHLFILGVWLGPSSLLYRVQVRALLPGGRSRYAGTPSEWSRPAEWPTREAGSSWSPDALLYVGLSVLAAVLCLVLFFIAQAGRRSALLSPNSHFSLHHSQPDCCGFSSLFIVCRSTYDEQGFGVKKARAWLKSSPAPDKSKLFFENKSLPFGHDALLQKEKTDISRVYHLDRFSSCSPSEAKVDNKGWPWPESVSEDEAGRLDCNDLISARNCGDHIGSNTSVVSFDGPYIFCKGTPEPPPQVSASDPQQVSEGQENVPCSCSDYVVTADAAPAAVALSAQLSAPTASCSLQGDYVFLPNPGPSKFMSTSTVEPEVTHLEVEEEEDQNQTELQSDPGNPMYVSLQPGTRLW